MNSKRVLSLPWIAAGFVFLILYLVGMWSVTLFVYGAYGLIAAIVTAFSLAVFGKVAVTPLTIRFLESRKHVKQ